MTNKFTVTTDDAQALTNKDLSGPGNTFPTLNQSTTGNAATATKLATARKVNGVPFDGTGDINAMQAFTPADYNFIAWNYDLARAGASTTALVAGEAYLMMVPIRAASIITNVILSIATAGAGLTSGQCFAGLFDSGGNLLSATADQSTSWQSAGLKTMALTTPQSVSAGFCYVGFFATGTTMPKPWFDNTVISNNGSVGPFATTPRSVLDTTNTGLTTSFHTPASLQKTNTAFWVAVS